MNKNVVDDFGDEYFINEYRGGLYTQNGLLYQLKGFNVNGKYVPTDSRYSTGARLRKGDFGTLEALEGWLANQEKNLEHLLEQEPNKYYQQEDEDGDLVDSEDISDDWEDWDTDVQKTVALIMEGNRLKDTWNKAYDEGKDTVCLEFTPLSEPDAEQLLINIEDFVSLKGFSLKQGFINVKGKVFNVNCRRCYKINNDTAKMLQEKREYAEQFLNPTYPTLQEAFEQLKKAETHESVAISRKAALVKETSYYTNAKPKIKWRLNSSDGGEIAFWVDGAKTLWARNDKILGYINKKG